MAKGVATTIVGTQYPRQKKAKAPRGVKRKYSGPGRTTGVKRVRGSGDYYVYDGKKKQATPWGNVGEQVGRWFGAPGLGFAAGHLIGRVVGSGDYMMSPFPVSRNILVNGKELPQFASDKISNVVCHREYIKDITTGAAGTFSLESFLINPGRRDTFPWLSNLAGSYEQYKIHGMIFEFKSTSADSLNSTNTALGSVTMSTEYDVRDANYPNKTTMQNAEFAQSAKPSLSQMHAIECDPKQSVMTQLYVKGREEIASSDQRFYDFAKFQIATSGFQASNVVIGELWVTYCIEFFKPQRPADGIIRSGLVSFADAGPAPFGYTRSAATGNLALTVGDSTVSWGVLEGEKYLVVINWAGDLEGTTASYPPTIGTPTLLSVGLARAAPYTNVVSRGGSSCLTYVVTATGTGTATFTCNTDGAYSDATNGTIIVSQLDDQTI